MEAAQPNHVPLNAASFTNPAMFLGSKSKTLSQSASLPPQYFRQDEHPKVQKDRKTVEPQLTT
jgi:hypothetical protein